MASLHFTDKELACKCCGQNKALPALYEALEALRAVAGPLIVTSGYRCPAHNQAIGGAALSYHCRGMAADIKSQSLTPAALYDIAAGVKDNAWRPIFGGLGLYSGWVHVDIRPARVTWRQ